MISETRPAQPGAIESARPEPLVRLDSVNKTYQMDEVVVTALRNVNLEIPRGQFVVALGPSGSGKTTLLNIVGGIDPLTSGRCVVGGREVSSMDERALTGYRRSQVGIVFQFFNLVPTLTARENVEMVAQLVGRQDSVDSALRTVGLEERGRHFPAQLSGGEQQRVAIARALVKDPPLLLCDEPTGELDFETGKLILAAMKRINEVEGKTIILVTHNAAIGQIADRVIRLRSGEIREDRLVESPISPDDLEW